jgi:hypothetical protein
LTVCFLWTFGQRMLIHNRITGGCVVFVCVCVLVSALYFDFSA